MQGGQNVRNDVHLVNPFHLGEFRMGTVRREKEVTSHQEVKVSLTSPLFLGKVSVNGFGHVR